MKRIFLNVVVLFIILCGIAVAEEVTIIASGECGKDGDNVTWTLDSARTLTISGEGAIRNYNWYNSPLSSYCTSIDTVMIQEGITSIGDYTFYDCDSLTSIIIPESMNSIGEYAFYGCNSLNKVVKVYADSLESWLNISFLGYYATPLCDRGELYIADELVTDLALPEGITQINNYAFMSCSSLSNITIPEGVNIIGEYAFSGCSSLSSITIPESVTSICDWVFAGCSSLNSITIPEGVTRIGNASFWGCSNLSDIILPNGLTSIGNSAFSWCSSLSSITIPENVTSIGNSAFYNCSSLRSITIPESVTSIGEEAFYGCSSLSNIILPNGLTSIGNSAFSWCRLSSITIPEGVTSIGSSAFEYCSSLQKVMFLGNDMPTLGIDVFSTSPTIYCYEFSGVDFWAAEKGYNCVYIDDMDLNTPISITLPQDMRIEMGENRTISAGLLPQTAKAEIVWQSSNPSVVSVENGVLTAHAIGEATITASCDELSDQMSVTVYASVESFELSETELWVVSKQSAQLDICNIQPAGATVSFYWGSSDTSVLTVSGGKITALKPGDATVTVTSDNGVVRSCLVHVCYPVTGIELEKSEYQMCLDGNAQIIANVTMRTQSCVNQLVSFVSSDEAVATVDASGNIHAVSAGTATITVSATSGVSATCTVTVEPCTHTPVTDPAVPATHVTTGLTEGSHCAICGEVLVAQQIVPIVQVEKVVLPAELEVIEAEAFAGDSFECVVLPEGCKAIGAGAFRDCAKLRFVEIPESVEFIDGSAFDGCSGLIIVTVPSSAALCFAQEKGITYVLR